MSLPVAESGSYTNLTASGLVRTGASQMLGIFVASASGATIKVWDNTAGSGDVIVNTFTPEAAIFYPIPANTKTGIYVTITGTVDCTVFWLPQ